MFTDLHLVVEKELAHFCLFFLITRYSFTSEVLLEYLLAPLPFPKFVSNTQEMWVKGGGKRQKVEEKHSVMGRGGAEGR